MQDTTIKFFKCNPFSYENNCGEFARPIQLGNCSFPKFLGKERKAKCKFVGGILEDTNFPFIDEENHTNKGLIFRMYEVIAQKLILNLSISIEDYEGEYPRFGTTFLQQKRLEEKHIDCVLIMIKAKPFLQYFGTTDVFYNNIQFWGLAQPPKLRNFQVILSIFKLETWMLHLTMTIFIFVLYATVISDKTITQISKSATDIFRVVLSFSLPIWPKPYALKFLLFVFMVHCMHVNFYFQAKLHSILTQPEGERAPNSLYEIEEFSVRPEMFLVTLSVINATNNPLARILSKNAIILNRFIKCKEKIKSILENPQVTSGIYSDCLRIHRGYEDKIKNIGHEFTFNMQGYLTMRKGHPLLKEINNIIGVINSAGLADKWISDLSMVKFQVGSESIVLTLQHVEGAIYMWIFGCVFSSVMFFIEYIYGRRMFEKLLKMKCMFKKREKIFKV